MSSCDPNCASCVKGASGSAICTFCQIGYTLGATPGTCVPAVQNCPLGSFATPNASMPCALCYASMGAASNCFACVLALDPVANMQIFRCTLCQYGFQLTPDGHCVPPRNNGTAVTCLRGCANCTLAFGQMTCVTCDRALGYYMSSGQCLLNCTLSGFVGCILCKEAIDNFAGASPVCL
jgi:hypothetical protein